MFCRRFIIDLTPVVDVVAAEFGGLVVVLETSACNLAAFLSVAIAAAFELFADVCEAGVTVCATVVVVVVVVVGCFAGAVFTTPSFFTFFVGAATVVGFSSGLSSKSRTDGTLVDVFAAVVVVFPLGLVAFKYKYNLKFENNIKRLIFKSFQKKFSFLALG